jgi:hypothetical protein
MENFVINVIESLINFSYLYCRDEVVFATDKDVGMRSEFQQLIPGGYVGIPVMY